MLLSRIWLLKKKNYFLFGNLKYKKSELNFFFFKNIFLTNNNSSLLLNYFFKSFSFNGKNLFLFKLINKFTKYFFFSTLDNRSNSVQNYSILKNLFSNNNIYFNISSVFFYIFLMFNFIFNFKVKAGKNSLITKSVNYIPYIKRFSSFFKFIKANMLDNFKKSYFLNIYSTLQILFFNPSNSFFIDKKRKLIQTFLY